MIKYDDFAMPSLENIENMAKAYAKMEKNYLSNKECALKEDFKVLQNIYNNIFISYDILVKLCSLYPKNRKFNILSEKNAKLKLEFESDYIDYELSIPNEKYTFAESSISYDLTKLWADTITQCLQNLKNTEQMKKISLMVIELIKEIIKY